MCGRYYIDTEEENIKTRAILAELEKRRLPMGDQVKGGEIAPSQIAPVILREPETGVTVRPMRWGFPRGKGLVINSRSERADSVPMFSEAAGSRRCLIPASWFYEWMHTNGRRTGEKFAFLLAGAQPSELMYMAGLYGQLDGGFAAGVTDCFAILTRAADEQMLPYHDRMPVILRPETLKKAWLNPAISYRELYENFTTPPALQVISCQTEAQKA